MKKIILFLALPCLALQLHAQKTEEKMPPPPPPPVAPPPPSAAAPPPEPAKVNFIAPAIVKDEEVKFTPPVIRPDKPQFRAPLILNKKGYQLTVKNRKGIDMVEVKSVSKTSWVKLSDWEKNSMYEKKYGELPPPPPPPLQKQEQ